MVYIKWKCQQMSIMFQKAPHSSGFSFAQP